MKKSTVALVLLVAAVVPGCTRDDRRPPTKSSAQPTETAEPSDASEPAPLPCGQLTSAPAGAASSPVRELGSFVSGTTELGRVWLWGHRVAYTPEDRMVVVCDLATGTTDIVARRKSGRGMLDWVRADRDTLVWIDFDRPVNSAITGSPWTMYARDLSTAKTTVIATGRPKDGHFTLPEPEIEWPYIVWTDLPRTGDINALGPELVVYDLRDGTRRTVSSGNFPDDPSVTNGLVYFTAKTQHPRPRPDTRDLYVVPADGSKPFARLTNENQDVVTQARARNGWVAWTLEPKAPKGPVDELPILALRAGTSTPLRVATGRPVEPGRDFVVYDFESSIYAAGPGGEEPFTVVKEGLDFASRWSVDGNRIAFVTVDDPNGERRPARLRIVELA